MSETVERRLVEILDHPTQSPYGNPIPGLAELGEGGEPSGYESFLVGVRSLDQVLAADGEVKVRLARIGEPIQTDEELMALLRHADVMPSRMITAAPAGESRVTISAGGPTVEVDRESAAHLFVRSV